MKKTILILACLAFAGASHGQIGKGKLGGLKDKVKGKGKGSSSSSTTTKPNVAVTAYDKHMKAGAKAEEDGDLKTAYNEYTAALEEKSGDYSASSALKSVKGDLSSYYAKQIDSAEAEGRCDEIATLGDERAEIFGSTTDPEYYQKRADKCKAALNAAKDKEAAAANQAGLQAMIEKMEKGKGYFFSNTTVPNFGDAQHKLGEPLMMFINLKKPLIQHLSSAGIDDDRAAYLFLTLKVDGKQVFVSDPYPMEQDFHLKENTYFNIPLSLTGEQLKSMDQTIMMFTFPQFITVGQYMYTASNLFTNGTHKLEVEYGLGKKGDKEPSYKMGSGSTIISADDSGRETLLKNAPKWMQPLSSSEKGKITLNNSNFSVGKGDLFFKYSLPHAPEYYQKKWQKNVYDHGDHAVLMYIDGELMARYNQEFWDDNWAKKKEFQGLLVPKSDANIDTKAGFPGLPELDKDGNLMIPMLDLIYGPALSAGKHKMRLVINSYDNKSSSSSFEQFPEDWGEPLADETFTFEVTAAGVAQMESSAGLIKPSKKRGGEWTAVESHLLKSNPAIAEGKILRVAATTDWKINRNALGVILSRECRVQVISESKKFGCRVDYVTATEQYDGSKYGKPVMPSTSSYVLAHPMILRPAGTLPIPRKKVN